MAAAGRGEHGRFVKGNHFNNGNAGRPKGLAEHARAITKDGAGLIRYMFDVFNDEKQETKLRMQAVEWLADRGWGKPKQTMDVAATVQVAKGYIGCSPDEWDDETG